MQEKIRKFIEEFHMIEEGDTVLAAVSGGADSLCLLLLLHDLCAEMKFGLCVVHVEHGIRGEESLKDAVFVEKICGEMHIPCKVCRCRALEYAGQHKLTVEEAARKLRYQLFDETAKEFGANKIAVAHNQNDCAETMLFHLARGSGLLGLCGIRPVRGQIIRPLLCVARGEIEEYLAGKGRDFCIDRTNEELQYTRNKIRRQVLPLLVQINTNAVTHMNQAAAFVAEAAELMEVLSRRAAEKYICRYDNKISISRELLTEPPAVVRTVLYSVLTEAAQSSKDISGIHVRQLWDLFARQNGKEADLPYGLRARRTYEGILLQMGEEAQRQRGTMPVSWELPPDGSLSISSYGYTIHTRIIEKMPQNEEIPKKMYTKWLDYDKIKNTTRLRTRQEGDYLVINREGKRKKLKKYFIDEKIPADQREQILLLADGAHILWVIGYRISEDVKVTEHTKRILEIRVDGGEKSE
ncbi:MAG: tRNA lysidine(34) synthetase TilS [Lachnospiraceae bacterium]|nr:tRNA lysidine(34) synthetase TilS [Lachnospiraceae bacterium]